MNSTNGSLSGSAHVTTVSGHITAHGTVKTSNPVYGDTTTAGGHARPRVANHSGSFMGAGASSLTAVRMASGTATECSVHKLSCNVFLSDASTIVTGASHPS